jgi:hypothetical protein
MSIVKPEHILFGTLLLFLSCKNSVDSHSNFVNDKIDTLLAKTIFLPENLIQLSSDGHYRADSFRVELAGKKSIISIIDGTCMKCVIDQLNALDSLFNAMQPETDSQMIFILNVKKADSLYFTLNLMPAIKAKNIILWDNDYHFENRNKLFTPHAYLRTFLTNSEGRIIQYGNPLINQNLVSVYQEKLKE